MFDLLTAERRIRDYKRFDGPYQTWRVFSDVHSLPEEYSYCDCDTEAEAMAEAATWHDSYYEFVSGPCDPVVRI